MINLDYLKYIVGIFNLKKKVNRILNHPLNQFHLTQDSLGSFLKISLRWRHTQVVGDGTFIKRKHVL